MKPKNTKAETERKLMTSPTRMDELSQQLHKMRNDIMDFSKEELKKRANGDLLQASGDEGDLSQAAADNDIRISQLSTKHSTLTRINEAIAKIDDGTYGMCNDCGENIPLGRLKVQPFATLCVACLEQVEQRQRVESAAVRDE